MKTSLTADASSRPSRSKSWLEVLHQRERATNADEMLRSRVRQLLKEAPRITLGVSPERPHRHWRKRAGALGLERVN